MLLLGKLNFHAITMTQLPYKNTFQHDNIVTQVGEIILFLYIPELANSTNVIFQHKITDGIPYQTYGSTLHLF